MANNVKIYLDIPKKHHGLIQKEAERCFLDVKSFIMLQLSKSIDIKPENKQKA